MKNKKHITSPVQTWTLDMYSYPKDDNEEGEWLCLTFCSFSNLSLCDKERVAFNQNLVKEMAGSPNERII